MAIVTVVLLNSVDGALTSWTSPGNLKTSTAVIFHAIGGGQAGHATADGSAATTLGGDGADYATATATLAQNTTYPIQLGTGGRGVGFSPGGNINADGQAGTDTWFKAVGGSTVVLAKGGASASTSVGTTVHVGGTALAQLLPTKGGGGGAGAGGPSGVGANSGTYASTAVGSDLLGVSWGGIGGGAGNGGEPGGGNYTISNNILHANGDLVIGGDGGDDLAGNQGARWNFSASGGQNGIGSGGAAGAQDNYNAGGTSSDKVAGIGGGTFTGSVTWIDTANPSKTATPGGGSGGGWGLVASSPSWSVPNNAGSPGGTNGAGGGGGGIYYYNSLNIDLSVYTFPASDIVYAPGGPGGEGALVIIYETETPAPPAGGVRRFVAEMGPVRVYPGAQSPTITSNGGGATAAIDVATGATAVTTVTATGTATIVYSIAGGTNASLFSINSSTGVLAFKSASSNGSYQVIVSATNDFGSNSQIITVTVATPFHASAVHLDGSTWLNIASIACTDSPNGYCFFWFKNWANIPNDYAAAWVTDPAVLYNNWCALTPSTGVFDGNEANAASSDTLKWHAAAGTFGTGWHSFLCAWETNHAAGTKKQKIYIDRVDVTGAIVDGSVSFTVGINGLQTRVFDDTFSNTVSGDVAVFSLSVGTSLFSGDGVPTSTLDLFTTTGNKPVAPSGFPGTQVILFNGNAAAFGTNQGSGGAFTTTGTLTNASTSPSD